MYVEFYFNINLSILRHCRITVQYAMKVWREDLCKIYIYGHKIKFQMTILRVRESLAVFVTSVHTNTAIDINYLKKLY